jgi:hypothetical protein
MGHSKTFALLAAMGLAAGAQAQTSQDEIRAYAAELLAQSEGRTSTLAQPTTPLVEIGGQIQFRYYVNLRDNVAPTVPPAAAGEDPSTGFQTRRTKLEAKGEVADGWSYFVQVNADFDGGSLELQEAWVKYQINENSNLQWGQFKLPLLREELVSSKRQLAADRSVLNEAFTQDRSQGIQYGWDGDSVRFRLAFSDGLDTENTDFNSPGGLTSFQDLGEADFALTGRVEYKGSGDWKQFDDFTSWQGSAFAWMIGGAGHYQNGGETNASFDHDLLQVTLDGSLEGSGWNAFGAFVYRASDVNGVVDADDFGFMAQGGVFVAPQWELFGRLDWITPDSAFAPVDEDFTTFTAGVNYYVIPESHAAKFTADVQYFINNTAETAIVSENTGIGLLDSAEDGEFVIRLQFQLLF